MTSVKRSNSVLQQPVNRFDAHHCLTIDVQVMAYHETGRRHYRRRVWQIFTEY